MCSLICVITDDARLTSVMLVFILVGIFMLIVSITTCITLAFGLFLASKSESCK